MSVALHLAENLDRLPDHDGTILFAARLLAPLYGMPPPRTMLTPCGTNCRLPPPRPHGQSSHAHSAASAYNADQDSRRRRPVL